VTRAAIGVNPSLTYTYDNLYRLTQATNPLPALPDESFEYDALGNRDPLTSTYDNANRLLNDGTNTYTYDDNGNLIQKVEPTLTTDYIYDAENQLIEIKENTVPTAQYRYDGLGRRIEKDVGGTVTRYVYDNEDIVLEYDGANFLLASYTHGAGIDEPLIMERGGNSFFYHTDGLGSITDLTNISGAVVQSYVYDSFGKIVAQNGSLINPYTYTGREFDSESDLYYYRARYYDASIGRFINEDPIGLVGGLNLFNYVENNPIIFADPSGLIFEKLNNLNPQIKTVGSFAASVLVEKVSEKLPRGRIRGATKVVSGLFAGSGTVFAAEVAIISGVLIVGGTLAVAGTTVALVVGAAATGVAVFGFIKTKELINQGLEEIKNPQAPTCGTQ